jgi:hypothetical protein
MSIICLTQSLPDIQIPRDHAWDDIKNLAAMLIFPMICNFNYLLDGCGFLPLLDRPYQYLYLMRPGHVRLLKIPPRFRLISFPFRNDAYFEMIEVPLTQAAPYEAISYVWGSSATQQKVYINGCYMFATENAHQALNAMRAALWRTRVVWIDSICINQSNDDEKAVQVALMREVFGRAKRVVGFLGGTSNQSLLAAQALQQIFATRVYQGTQYKHLSRTSMLSKWKAMTDLLSTPWFHRIWIIQEVAVAQEMKLIYGDRSVLWDDLIKLANIVLYSSAAETIWIKAGISNESFRQCLRNGANIIFMGQLRENFQKRIPIDRLETLRRGSMFDATVPRDRIYALRGLFRDEKTPSEPTPNYEPDFEFAAWSQYALWLMAGRQPALGNEAREIDLSALHYAGIGISGHLQRLPSWVPDWRNQRIPKRLFRFERDFQASIGIKAATISSRNPHVLQLRGHIVDSIAKLTKSSSNISISPKFEFNEAWVDLFDRSAFLLQALHLAKTNCLRSFSSESSFEQAFTRAMIADTDANNQKASEETVKMYLRFWKYIITIFNFFTSMHDGDYASEGELLGLEELHKSSFSPLFAMNERLQAVFDAFEKRTSPISMEAINKIRAELKQPIEPTGTNTEESHRQRNNFARLESFQIQRRFTVTGHHRMGLVPELSMPRDLVVIIFGLSTPCLLRPIEDSIPAKYKFVGPCYIHGMMDGEIMNQRLEDARFEVL